MPASGSGTGGLYATSNVFDTAQTPKHGGILDPNNVGVGSEPWGHPSCWYVIEDPDGNRQWSVQRSASSGSFNDGNWTITYSPSALFGAGQTPGVDWDEDTAPTASDGAVLLSASNIFTDSAGSTLTHVAADDVASPTGEYGVICMEFQATNSLRGMFLVDDLRDASANHPHALVTWAMNTSNNLTTGAYHSSDSPGGVSDYGGSTEIYVDNFRHCFWDTIGGVGLPGNGGTGVDGQERAAPIFVGFQRIEGYVGSSRWFRDPSVSRGYPNTGSTLQYLFVNDLLVVDLWDGVTTPGTV